MKKAQVIKNYIIVTGGYAIFKKRETAAENDDGVAVGTWVEVEKSSSAYDRLKNDPTYASDDPTAEAYAESGYPYWFYEKYLSLVNYSYTYGNEGWIDPIEHGVPLPALGDGRVDQGSDTLYVWGDTSDSSVLADKWLSQGYSSTYCDLYKIKLVIGYVGPHSEPWQELDVAHEGNLWYQHYELKLLNEINDSKNSWFYPCRTTGSFS